MNISLQDGFHCADVLKTGEPDLSRRLHILRLLDQNALGIFQQGTFEKQNRAVFLKTMD